MTAIIRLNEREKEEVRKKAIEINKLLIGRGMQPMRDSQLVHKILEKSIRYARLGEGGDVIIDVP